MNVSSAGGSVRLTVVINIIMVFRRIRLIANASGEEHFTESIIFAGRRYRRDNMIFQRNGFITKDAYKQKLAAAHLLNLLAIFRYSVRHLRVCHRFLLKYPGKPQSSDKGIVPETCGHVDVKHQVDKYEVPENARWKETYG